MIVSPKSCLIRGAGRGVVRWTQGQTIVFLPSVAERNKRVKVNGRPIARLFAIRTLFVHLRLIRGREPWRMQETNPGIVLPFLEIGVAVGHP